MPSDVGSTFKFNGTKFEKNLVVGYASLWDVRGGTTMLLRSPGADDGIVFLWRMSTLRSSSYLRKRVSQKQHTSSLLTGTSLWMMLPTDPALVLIACSVSSTTFCCSFFRLSSSAFFSMNSEASSLACRFLVSDNDSSPDTTQD
jgi:hypothetical protein